MRNGTCAEQHTNLWSTNTGTMLAYVLWHHRRTAALAGVYEAGLAAFHEALGRGTIPGFIASSTHIVSKLPWLQSTQSHEDWYIVENWEAIGELNDAAIAGAHKTPHDLTAHSAIVEGGAMYRLRAGTCALEATSAMWFNKPSNMAYWVLQELLDQYVRVGVCGLWQRQLALGPSPEFCILGPCDLLTDAFTVINAVREPVRASEDLQINR
jgi:hypothetical protein